MALPSIRWRPISGTLLLFGAAVGCASPYEPEGQFWTSSEPAGLGVGPTTSAGGAAADGSSGSAAGATVGVPLDEGTGSDTSSDEGTSIAPPLDNGASSDVAPTAQGGTAATSSIGATQGSAGAGGSPSQPAPTDAVSSAGTAVDSATCSLSVSVTTTAPGGRYRPRNVGAIWVADASGGFVKSLDVWGNRRLSHVTAWTAATKAANLAGNKVDAVTAATLSAHRTHQVTWNCRDTRDQIMPDGTYRVYLEVTDSNGSGPNHFETFTKGPMAATVEGNATNFNDITLTFVP